MSWQGFFTDLRGLRLAVEATDLRLYGLLDVFQP